MNDARASPNNNQNRSGRFATNNAEMKGVC